MLGDANHGCYIHYYWLAHHWVPSLINSGREQLETAIWGTSPHHLDY